jgi:sugar/nucleoside kinase (ribokinase family)
MSSLSSIHVLGDLNLDIILSGLEGTPAFGKERIASACRVKPGGSAANVSMMLAINNCPVRLYAQAGNDEAGRLAIKQLERYGLDTRTISISAVHTTGLTVSLTFPEDRMYVTYPGSVAQTRARDLTRGFIDDSAHLHLSSFYLQTSLKNDMGAILRTAKSAGMSTSLDPGGDTSDSWNMAELIELLQYLDYFMPSSDEICAMTGKEDVHEAVSAFPGEAGIVIVKAGARGALTRRGNTVEAYPAIPVDTVDTTCAGDCFDAGFLYGLYTGYSFEGAIQKGLQFGAQAVSTLGLPSENIEHFLKEFT